MKQELKAAHQIGEVADLVGLSLRTIRHYEEMGLVPPSGRTSGGFRLYSDEDVERLRIVKQMKPLKFTLEEMRDLLEIQDRLQTVTDSDAAEGQRLREQVSAFAGAADEQCARLREQLQQAESFARSLRRAAGGPGRGAQRTRTVPAGSRVTR